MNEELPEREDWSSPKQLSAENKSLDYNKSTAEYEAQTNDQGNDIMLKYSNLSGSEVEDRREKVIRKWYNNRKPEVTKLIYWWVVCG